MSKIATQVWQHYENNGFSGNFNDFSSKIYLKFAAQDSRSEASFAGFDRHNQAQVQPRFRKISNSLADSDLDKGRTS